VQKKSFELTKTLNTNSIALLVQTASNYASSVKIMKGNKTASAKSIMGIFSLELQTGDTVAVVAEGADESEAVAEIGNYFS